MQNLGRSNFRKQTWGIFADTYVSAIHKMSHLKKKMGRVGYKKSGLAHSPDFLYSMFYDLGSLKLYIEKHTIIELFFIVVNSKFFYLLHSDAPLSK